MFNLIKKIINGIKGKRDCPAYWSERWHDGDGCRLYYGDPYCWKCKYRFYPDFTIKMLIKKELQRQDDYWK